MAGIGLGCKETAEPRPSRTTVLLSTAYRFGPCEAAWEPATPGATRTVVDFYFGNNAGAPTAQQVAAVEQAGGVVRYLFHVPIVRAEIDVDAVAGIVQGTAKASGASYAITVPDTSRRDVQLIVVLSRPVTDADIAAVESLGGTVTNRWSAALNGYAVAIADAQVPRLVALPGITSVERNGLACLD